MKCRDVFGESVRLDRLAQFAHQGLVIMQVVDGVEPPAQRLAGPQQVVQVGPAEMAAGVAVAVRIDRLGIGAVAGGLDPEVAMAGGKEARAGGGGPTPWDLPIATSGVVR